MLRGSLDAFQGGGSMRLITALFGSLLAWLLVVTGCRLLLTWWSNRYDPGVWLSHLESGVLACNDSL